MLSTELTPSPALPNASYQHANTSPEIAVTRDETCLPCYEATSTTYERSPTTTTITTEATETSNLMTKQLTTATATNAASSITQASNLAPTVVSPTTITTEAATTTTTTTTTPTTNGNGTSIAECNNGATKVTTPSTLQQQTKVATKTTTTTATTKTIPASANDASGRSAALERAYVHDVYEHCEEPTGPVRPRVAQFLSNLDPGSVVCDVGCGSGRYLTQCNPTICTIGVDRCYRLGKVAHEKGGEVTLCDNLELPFRDECCDAVLSLAVVHHFATTERRVRALRELARILRVGGRVVITVWALEQRHRRFESQDVLIPWQPPKNRNLSYSDEEEDDDFLPPYHAYTEDSTNSSRSAGDGDSSSLSSSSPGESCYSFVRRAIQKLAGGRRHAWFLDSWTSKDTKNDSSLDYEDAKDLPIELRRLEDFEDFQDPPLSAGLKSRSLGSILQPPPRQIVRSRSSVPSLGGPLLGPLHSDSKGVANFLSTPDAAVAGLNDRQSPTNTVNSSTNGGSVSASNTLNRRPKLIKQKQSLCEEDSQQQLPDAASPAAFYMLSSYNSANQNVSSSLYMRSGCYAANFHQHASATGAPAGLPSFLRKQSSLNEELMACNRIREKERVRKRIQKQTSLNEAFLCRSAMFSKRLQVIREGFTTKIKSSTGSLERATKTGLSKIMQNLKSNTSSSGSAAAAAQSASASNQQSMTSCQTPNLNNKPTAATTGCATNAAHHQQQPQQHHHHHHIQQTPNGSLFPAHLSMLHKPAAAATTGPVTYCSNSDCSATSICHCSAYHQDCAPDSEESKARRHSRESGSDSSKDSLQSDTSIESEDSFASVIFIPKPEQHQQQLNYQHQNSNSSSSNSSSSNGKSKATATARLPPHSVPTSPLIMPCPPTPAHSPAATQGTVTSPPQTMAAVSAAMAILTPPSRPERFNFDEAHIKQQQTEQTQHKITRQTIKDLPPIPKFRKQQSLQLQRQSFPIVRRASGSSSSGGAHKLLSLELFNPATDDLDSDSSEPSSPDSIDSVISAPKSAQLPAKSGEELAELIKSNQQHYQKGELQINKSTPNDIILNAESVQLLPQKHAQQQPQDCAEFAEQLSAQLQRDIEDKSSRNECRSLDGIGDLAEYLDEQQQRGSGSGSKKRSNGDLSALREELRERRLMLANLSTQPSLQQSPSSSNSSLSFTIHEEDEGEEEEDENERSYTLGLYEHCKISKFNYKRNRHYNLNPETAYLLQEDGDSDVRDDDDDVIPEEDEDAEALEARGGDQLGEGMHEYGQRRRNVASIGAIKASSNSSNHTSNCSEGDSSAQQTLQQRSSTESWEHSNSSTTSLDSPSQGGATTHHRYYHVFREGELDALINHHVASLHIVSSYYERASWCIVAEKVQVWTI